MKKHIKHRHIVTEEEANSRIDVVLSNQLTGYSRAQIQTWMKLGHVHINGQVCVTAKTRLHAQQEIYLETELIEHSTAQAEAIPITKIFEDAHIMVINKPAGLVVHPGAGNSTGTLMNALLHDCANQSVLPRAGIIHRLDKDTTGVMIVAKTFDAYHTLTEMLAERAIKRQYIAIVDGNLKSGLTVNQSISRHSTIRQKMAVTDGPHGKPAISHVTLLQRLDAYTLIQVDLETGRTHQIRVHMQYLGHPLLGDRTYGKHRGYQALDHESAAEVLSFPRQALHARRVAFAHPINGKPCQFDAPIPDDFQHLIRILKGSNPNL